MPVETWVATMWLGLALADEPPRAPAPPDTELLEFLGSFETQTGPWPELDEALRKNPPASKSKEEVQR